MAAYKKEHAGAKKEGIVDEREADPINGNLFTLICSWAVEEMNILIWVFSLLMWHMMALSISISSIALHNIKRGVSNSIQFKYDEKPRWIKVVSLCRLRIASRIHRHHICVSI